MTRGSAGRMKKGGLPSLEILSLICRVENASYRYLAEGVGAPFRVSRLSTDEEMARAIGDVWEDGGWQVVLIEHEGRLRAVVFVQPCSVDVGDGDSRRVVEYPCLEIVSGPVGVATLARCNEIKRAGGGARVRALGMDADTLNRLLCGEMGTYALLRAQDAPLWLRWDREPERVAVDEPPPPPYLLPSSDTEDTAALAMAIAELDAPMRAHVAAIVRRLSGTD